MMTDDDSDEEVELLDLLDENSHVRVQRRRCDTCIYWDDNRMNLSPGRRAQMEADADAADGWITCHQTLPYSEYEVPPAVCHGYWLHAKWTSFRLRIALIFKAYVYVDPPSTTWNPPERTDT